MACILEYVYSLGYYGPIPFKSNSSGKHDILNIAIEEGLVDFQVTADLLTWLRWSCREVMSWQGI